MRFTRDFQIATRVRQLCHHKRNRWKGNRKPYPNSRKLSWLIAAQRMLSAQQQEELCQALAGPATDGAKRWSVHAVADWMAATLGRPVQTQRGWDYL